MFEKATKLKLRFASAKGALSVEDLWSLPLTGATSLDAVAKLIARELKSEEEESFVVKTSANTVLELKLDLVKHVINVRLAEKEAKDTAKDTKEHNEKIMNLIAQKELEGLAGKSIADLKKELK